MDVEAAPELIFDQGLGLYYPAVADCYGYYYAGPEPVSEWDSHHQFFGQDSHMPVVQTESLPNVYYIPSYGYVQSPYNPYNPSIPGAVLGTEASFIETPYPTNPPHQLVVSSPAYIPLGIDSSSDTVPNSYLNPLFTSAGTLPALKPDGESKKMASLLVPHLTPINRFQVSSVHSEHLASNALQLSSEQPHAVSLPKEVPVGYSATTRHSSVGSFINGSITGPNQGPNQLSNLRVSSAYRPAKATTIQPSNGYMNYGSEIGKWSTGNAGDNFRPRLQVSTPWVNRNGILPELNRGPRANVARCRRVSPLFVKAYTTKAGAVDPEGNIIISADTYNRDDFPIDYESAKFFVIKSYSEDDVHKSIKYNVWSSTPSGNKRLENAYEEAQKASLGRPQRCPIFLFFSVNASGQFCGVAEMTGPVDFQKDMDFWQQDKWLGSFPVNWHMIKDVSNTSLRHILLENNEFKPVTCSRDTQEIPFLQGMAMLRIFKTSPSEASILDDFVHYEERQRILVEEKSRISGRRCNNAQYFSAPLVGREALESTTKEATLTIQEPTQSDQGDDPHFVPNGPSPKSKICKDSNSNDVKRPSKSKSLVILGRSEEQPDDGLNSIVKIGSLLIDPKAGKDDLSLGSQDDVITVGSMHIKVVGKHVTPPGVSTMCSIPPGVSTVCSIPSIPPAAATTL